MHAVPHHGKAMPQTSARAGDDEWHAGKEHRLALARDRGELLHGRCVSRQDLNQCPLAVHPFKQQICVFTKKEKKSEVYF